MPTQQVGMREFRENMATYVQEADGPVAITRHGDTIGYYLPVKRRWSEAERAALNESAEKLQREMAQLGLTEEELMEDIRVMREEKKKAAKR